jgi:hypothetical protein
MASNFFIGLSPSFVRFNPSVIALMKWYGRVPKLSNVKTKNVIAVRPQLFGFAQAQWPILKDYAKRPVPLSRL